MREWYKDKKLAVYFSCLPQINFNYPHHNNLNCSKPFVLINEVEVKLEDYIKNKTYSFIIPKGYCWDGATIPRIFWRLIGAKTEPKFLIASLVHDVLCENHHYIDNDRIFSTRVFERLLYVSGVAPVNRCLMKNSVNLFQVFCKW